MTEVFLGQIMLTGFAFAPKNFALCNGQVLPISQNQALFSLLGTVYGGNGQTTFCLPNLQGRIPVGYGTSVDSSWSPSPYQMGETGGVESVTLLPMQLPVHTHAATGTTTTGNQRNPTNALYGTNSAAIYGPGNGPQVPLSGTTVTPAGNSQPHANIQPYQVISYCIAQSGIFPSRN